MNSFVARLLLFTAHLFNHYFSTISVGVERKVSIFSRRIRLKPMYLFQLYMELVAAKFHLGGYIRIILGFNTIHYASQVIRRTGKEMMGVCRGASLMVFFFIKVL